MRISSRQRDVDNTTGDVSGQTVMRWCPREEEASAACTTESEEKKAGSLDGVGSFIARFAPTTRVTIC